MYRVIHLWANTSAWWWAVQSKAFSRDGDTDRRQSRGLERPAGSIFKWRVGYHWHASAVSMAHTSHELWGRTVRLLEDSTADELRRRVYLGPPGKSLWRCQTAERTKSPTSKGFYFAPKCSQSFNFHLLLLLFPIFFLKWPPDCSYRQIWEAQINKQRMKRTRAHSWMQPPICPRMIRGLGATAWLFHLNCFTHQRLS